MSRRRTFALLIVAIVAALAACGSDSGTPSTTPTSGGGGSTPGSTPALTQGLGNGVDAETIKLGVSLVDFECIKPYVDQIRIDQEDNYNAFIDDINENGGVAGRKIVPVYHSYCPIGNAEVLTLCTTLAEDDKVFAVVGNFVDFNGDAQTCLAKKNKIPLITFQLTQAILDKSPPGLIILPGRTAERSTAALLDLANQEGLLEGKKVGIMGETVSKSTVEDAVEPGLDAIGVERGTTAILNITDDDTTTPQAQLDAAIERWKDEDVTAIFITGTQVAHKQFVEKIRAAMPDVMLLSDDPQVLTYGKEEQKAGKSPNPYEGILSPTGPSAEEYEKSENWAYCTKIYKDQTGKDAPGPLDVIPGPDGKNLDTYGSINDACQIMSIFQDIGEKIGEQLNPANWVLVADTFGPIVNRGGGEFASLTKGKYDVDDTVRLSEYDSSIPPNGDWNPVTELKNAAS